jgi:hypothetical protein
MDVHLDADWDDIRLAFFHLIILRAEFNGAYHSLASSDLGTIAPNCPGWDLAQLPRQNEDG